MLRKISLVMLALVATSCANSYAHKPPLEFRALPYVSVSGARWPEKTVQLPKTAELHRLPEIPELTYVELNPEGERTLVFLHGLGSYLKFWRYQLDVFAEQGWRVIALDMLGYGKSDKPATFPYTMEAMGDVVREVLALTGTEQPILVGHSMGGQVALSIAIRHPAEVAGLVLTAPAGFERFSRAEKAWFKSVFTTSLVKGSQEDAIWGSVRRNNFFQWSDDYEWLIEERVRLSRSEEMDAYAYANVRSIQGLADNDFVRDNLKHVKLPVLIVHGDRDRLIPNPFLHGGSVEEVMEYGRQQIKGSERVALEACGHTVQIDCHDAYNQTVAAFLEPLRTAPDKNVAAQQIED